MGLINLHDQKEHEPVPGYRVRFVHTDHMTFAFWDIKKGYAVGNHSHPHEQVIKVLKGELQVTTGGKKHDLRPGLVLTIPSNQEHSAISITDCQAIDTFYPVREDYKNL